MATTSEIVTRAASPRQASEQAGRGAAPAATITRDLR